MAKALPQRVAEAILKKSFTHIPLTPGEMPEDNPFLLERPSAPRMKPMTTRTEDSANASSRRP